MAVDWNDMGIADPPGDRARMRRSERVIVNDAGEFAAPASLSDVAPHVGMLGYRPLYEVSGELSPALDEPFVFDDDPSWKQPVSSVPMTARPKAQEPERKKNVQKREPEPRKAKKTAGGGGRSRDRHTCMLALLRSACWVCVF